MFEHEILLEVFREELGLEMHRVDCLEKRGLLIFSNEQIEELLLACDSIDQLYNACEKLFPVLASLNEGHPL